MVVGPTPSPPFRQNFTARIRKMEPAPDISEGMKKEFLGKGGRRDAGSILFDLSDGYVHATLLISTKAQYQDPMPIKP